MKKLEIERKYILKNVPQKISWDRVISIKQYYITHFKMQYRLRVVSENGEKEYFQTTKEFVSPGVNFEDEITITRKEFQRLLRPKISFLEKTRYIKKVGKLKWEVDEYKDMKLVTAEIELPDLAHPFHTPNFIKKELITEVTAIKEFSNKNLAKKI